VFFINELVEKALEKIDKRLSYTMTEQSKRIDDLLVLQGRSLALSNADRAPLTSIHEAEFKVFSQFGEDGILQYLARETGIRRGEQTFVEFGVQNYVESNTRFLLFNDNWRGLILDGSEQYINSVRSQDLYWRHDLTAIAAWITRDNINDLVKDAGFYGDVGILSVDIDGNDYWVWERISVINPVIVVVEWNSVFGPDHAISIPYSEDFQRGQAHYSNLYWGASIQAFNHLAERKGYALLGSNTAANNLFFVRRDRLGRLTPLPPHEAYLDSRFRDSRDANHQLNFLSGPKRLPEILDLPVVEVTTETTTTLRQLGA
jgi:hypothetical protein